MRANLFVILMIYMSISIFLYVGGVRVVEADTTSFLDKFIDVNAFNNGSIAVSKEFEDAVPSSYSESAGGGILSFIDVLGSIKSFLVFMVNVLFSPIGLFVGSGIPSQLAIFIALPLLIAGVLAFIYFVRSGQ